MPLWPNFVGQAYFTQSASIAADNCINIFLETTRNAADPKRATFYGTPGQLSQGVQLPAVNCRGLFSQDGRVFGVAGGSFFEWAWPATTTTNVHPVANDGLLVTFASNGQGGNQLAVCSANTLYIFNLATAVWTTVTLSFVPVMVGYMDGYFLANEKNTPKMWFSNLMNGLTWSATDFFTRSSTSDNLVGFAVNNRRIWALGSKTTELFQDSGDATTPFIPIPGSVMNEGTNSYQSITTIADTVFWVGSTKEFGHAQIFAGAGLQPRVISTPPISYAISASTNIAEAEALSYTQRGHVFICWTWPSLNGGRGQTWCYDLTEEAWHQRATWAAAGGDFQYLRWSARASCAFANPASGLLAAPLVGQVDSFWLCTLSLDTYTDQLPGTPSTTQPIIRLRTAPYLSAENQWFFLQQIELGIEASLGGLTAPNVMLRLNPNNGASASWTPFMPAAIGLQVDGQAVAQWFQLGRARADRLVLQIVQNNAAPCVWGPGLYLRASPGTGQL